MARMGKLKPLRGTASNLANIVLQSGEVAFDYLPENTYGDYGIKMGDGTTVYSELPYLIKRTKESTITVVNIPEVTVGEYVYDGTEQGPTIEGLDSEHCTVTDDKKIQPGNYTMTISLNDTTTCIWSDETTDPKTYPYSIEEAWEYDTGTNEAALLNNIKHPEYETIGKIYYIQAYFNDSITQNVPYMVIGVNHDGTTGTMDLMSKVYARNVSWTSGSGSSWTDGKYTTSNMYNWLPNTCPNGYSANIQAKMCYMTERWREATGNRTGTLQTRQTKCKLLNPVELFGTSAANSIPAWEYGSSSDHKTKFLTDNYGTLYPVWPNNIDANTNRRVFSNLAMTSATKYWTNSWLALLSDLSCAICFLVGTTGNSGWEIVGTNSISPVIRLSQSPS